MAALRQTVSQNSQAKGKTSYFSRNDRGQEFWHTLRLKGLSTEAIWQKEFLSEGLQQKPGDPLYQLLKKQHSTVQVISVSIFLLLMQNAPSKCFSNTGKIIPPLYSSQMMQQAEYFR